MKTRKGFVSNSSSSSFIVILAEVSAKQEEKVKKEGLGNYLKTGEDLLGEMKEGWFKLGADWAGVFLDLEKEEISEEKKYFHFEEYSGDDDAFWSEESGGFEYDIDLDFFGSRTQEIYNFFENETGLCKRGFGAGRNG